MTGPRPLLALSVGIALVFAGCVGGPGTPTAGPTPTPDAPTDDSGSNPTDTPESSPTEAPGSTSTPSPGPARTDGPIDVTYESYVFDHGPASDPAIAGGIRFPEEYDRDGATYVTTVATEAETDRFNRSILDSGATAFVDETDFESASIVVLQLYPASSVPDVRAESVRRDGDTLLVATNRSRAYGTDDITVETLLLRVHGDPPEAVSVTSEDGETVDWPSEGIGTVSTRTIT